MKIMRINLIGIVNLYISTIVLLNAGTVPTVWYIFFPFIIGYEKKTAELQLLKKNMVVIVFRN
jgi:ABC-type anion transport system duplicated permease subunit